jgi:hypothetical protein
MRAPETPDERKTTMQARRRTSSRRRLPEAANRDAATKPARKATTRTDLTPNKTS